MTRRTSTPVLIVGAGPAGLVTALILARQGVRSTLVERHPGTSIYPRASASARARWRSSAASASRTRSVAFSLDAIPMMRMSPVAGLAGAPGRAARLPHRRSRPRP